MGSSGYLPHESDETETTLLFILSESNPKKIKDALLHQMNDKTNLYEHETARYVAWTIGKLHKAGLLKDKELFKAAKTAYERIMADQEWIECWDNQKAIKKALRSEYRLFQNSK